jgi:hypothetical protein
MEYFENFLNLWSTKRATPWQTFYKNEKMGESMEKKKIILRKFCPRER